MTCRLIVFARYPVAGKCKTRLIPAIGPDGAAAVHRQLLQHTLGIAQRWRDQETSSPRHITLSYTGATPAAMQSLCPGPWELVAQSDGDLGQKLSAALHASKSAGDQLTLIIGTDCPSLHPGTLARASRWLAAHDVVVGPADDGGYYLLGVNHERIEPDQWQSLLRGIDWGTERVLQQTLAVALRNRWQFALLETLDDLDRPEDLYRWGSPQTIELIQAHGHENGRRATEHQERNAFETTSPIAASSTITPGGDFASPSLASAPALYEATPLNEPLRLPGLTRELDSTPELSIVIPVFNHEPNLALAIASTMQNAPPNIERVIVAAGDLQQTVATAVAQRTPLVTSLPGRGRQLNRGAQLVDGQALLFLHADTQLPGDYLAETRRLLSNQKIGGGAFQLAIAAAGWQYRLMEWGTQLRSRWWGVPYGDQAIFVRRQAFQELAGFREWPLMEDYDLAWRLRRRFGLAISRSAVTTSPRRWQRLGVGRTWLRNQQIICGYWLGYSPERLRQWY